MDNQELITNNVPTVETNNIQPTEVVPTAPQVEAVAPSSVQPVEPTLPGNDTSGTVEQAPVANEQNVNTTLPGNENTTTPVEQALPGDALPGDTVQNLELSDANSTGPATRAAGLTGMVTFDYNNTPITDIVNSIILDAIDKGVSDIHLDPYEEGIKIRIRIDGLLHDYSIVPLYVKRNLVTRIKIISGMNITESRIPQDGAIRTTINDQPIDIRVSVLPTNMGEKVVLRIMDYTMSAQGIDNIDFSEFNIKKIHKMMELPNGIILVTGATGSGKSTTVYSVLQELNDEETNIITVEDPVEMNIEGINQVQTQSEIGLTFASVLRSILRQDPDIIMVGEIRDDETARIAVRAAITGHLVLSTIHTNNALNTIERLTDMSVERYLLGSALSGIISQKLARRLCPKCKKLRPTTDYEKEIFRKTMKQEVNEIYDAVGCDECSKGYRGRIAVHEVLLLNQHVRDAITQNVPKSELRKAVYGRADTRTMLEDGLEKVLNGSTTFDEIIKLIDLDDDLGSDTQLGLQNQIEDTEINNSSKTTQTNNVKEEKVETTPSEEKVETIETTKQVETTKEIVNEPISNTTEEKPPISFSKEPKPEEVTNAVNSELSFLKNNPLFRNIEQ